MGIQLASIPLLTTTLGTEQFAAYTLVLALMGWFALLDLGTGNAVQNFAAEARANNESAGTEIGAVAALAATIESTLFIRLPDIDLLYVAHIIAIACSLFVLVVVGNTAQRLLYGLGFGVFANLLSRLRVCCR
jgi:O-antigen/teichoic acid export membrane protein